MSRLAAVILLLLVFGLSFGQKTALKLKAGDRLAVSVFGVQGYDGEFAVLSDGSITGRGFGRLVVAGQTVDQVTSKIRARLKATMKDPLVTVAVLSEQLEFVYITGAKSATGAGIPLAPDMDLRQAVTLVELPADADLLEARLFRGNSLITAVNVADLLRQEKASVPLKPNDVVAILPVEFVRIWVTGSVAKPGELRLRKGSDIYQAIAASGGLGPDALGKDDTRVILHRGPSVMTFPSKQAANSAKVELEPGDTVTVQTSTIVRVTVGGEVKAPGDYQLRENNSLTQAIATAGGATPDGTLTTVLLVRQGTVTTVDATSPALDLLQDGDVVLVQRNQRLFTVMGAVNKAGVVPMEDKKTYRVTDAVALAGGQSEKASLHRVYRGRAGKDGKMVIDVIALDKFLKNGDVASNPEVLPGDVYLIDEQRGVTLGNAAQLISSGILFFNVIKK